VATPSTLAARVSARRAASVLAVSPVSVATPASTVTATFDRTSISEKSCSMRLVMRASSSGALSAAMVAGTASAGLSPAWAKAGPAVSVKSRKSAAMKRSMSR